MFGDPYLNSRNWEIDQLSKHIRFITSGSRGWAKYFTDKGEYFLTIKNIKNCNVNVSDVQHIIPPSNAEAKRTKVQKGDLLISITADLGRTGVITESIAEHGAYINQHLTCIRLNQQFVNPLYVAYYMESAAGKREFDGGENMILECLPCKIDVDIMGTKKLYQANDYSLNKNWNKKYI